MEINKRIIIGSTDINLNLLPIYIKTLICTRIHSWKKTYKKCLKVQKSYVKIKLK